MCVGASAHGLGLSALAQELIAMRSIACVHKAQPYDHGILAPNSGRFTQHLAPAAIWMLNVAQSV